MPSTRRAVLGAIGVAATPLGGCTEPSSVDSPADESTATGGTTTTSSTPVRETVRRRVGESIRVDGLDLTVADARVRTLLVAQGTAHDWLRHDDGQYLLVGLSGWQPPTQRSTPTAPPPDDFAPMALVLDGEGHDPEHVYHLADVPPHQTPSTGETYQRSASGYVPGAGVPIPITDPASASIRWRGDERDAYWELGETVRTRMGQQPDFGEATLAIDPVAEETVEVRAEVRNAGDVDGIWYAQFSPTNFSGHFFLGVCVPAGETHSTTVRRDGIGPGSEVRFVTPDRTFTEFVPEPTSAESE